MRAECRPAQSVPPKPGDIEGSVNLDVNNLLLYGRKEVRIPHIVAGLVLMVYPYFVGSLVLELVIAVVVIGGLAFASRAGI